MPLAQAIWTQPRLRSTWQQAGVLTHASVRCGWDMPSVMKRACMFGHSCVSGLYVRVARWCPARDDRFARTRSQASLLVTTLPIAPGRSPALAPVAVPLCASPLHLNHAHDVQETADRAVLRHRATAAPLMAGPPVCTPLTHGWTPPPRLIATQLSEPQPAAPDTTQFAAGAFATGGAETGCKRKRDHNKRQRSIGAHSSALTSG